MDVVAVVLRRLGLLLLLTLRAVLRAREDDALACCVEVFVVVIMVHRALW